MRRDAEQGRPGAQKLEGDDMSAKVVKHTGCFLCGRSTGLELPAHLSPVLQAHYSCGMDAVERLVALDRPTAPPQADAASPGRARGKGRGWRLGERGKRQSRSQKAAQNYGRRTAAIEAHLVVWSHIKSLAELATILNISKAQGHRIMRDLLAAEVLVRDACTGYYKLKSGPAEPR